MTARESWNAYTEAHFPDDWDVEDFEFLARFVAAEFDAQFVGVVNPERSYDYELLVEAEDRDA